MYRNYIQERFDDRTSLLQLTENVHKPNVFVSNQLADLGKLNTPEGRIIAASYGSVLLNDSARIAKNLGCSMSATSKRN